LYESSIHPQPQKKHEKGEKNAKKTIKEKEKRVAIWNSPKKSLNASVVDTMHFLRFIAFMISSTKDKWDSVGPSTRHHFHPLGASEAEVPEQLLAMKITYSYLSPPPLPTVASS